MLKVDFKDLVFKSYSDLKTIKETSFDESDLLSDIFSINSKKQSLNFIVIFYEKKVGNKSLTLQSSKIYEDLDTIKIKIYLNGGFINIEHSSDFSTYRFDLNFLYQ